MFPQALRPHNLAKKLGAFDAIPDAMARMTGALRLMETAFSQKPAPVRPTPMEIVELTGSARLFRYVSDTPRKYERPILLCPSLINRPYILDLKEGISVVHTLVEAGHSVYVIDWGDPAHAELNLDFSDHVAGRLRHFINRTLEDSGARDLHLFGHCLGGTMTTALCAVDDEGIASLINLTAPIRFHDDGILSPWGTFRPG
jgi:polyhydroxyalkanoate synthase